MRALSLSIILALSGCCKTRPPRTLPPVVKVERNCLGDLTPPEVTDIRTVKCEGTRAALCLPFAGAQALLQRLDAYQAYVASVEARCSVPKKEEME